MQHRKWQAESAGMRAEDLDALPNALDAEYWLRKAAAEEQAGRPEVRLQHCRNALEWHLPSSVSSTTLIWLQEALAVLKEALERDVRPTTDVLRGLQELNKKAQAQEGGQVAARTGSMHSTTALGPGIAMPPKPRPPY